MKRIILTFAAIITMSVASAQTEPNKANRPPQIPSTTLPPPKTEIKDKPVKDAQIQNDAVNRQSKKQDEVQPRKDELKTQDHVKGTSRPKKVNDTVKPAKTKMD